MKEFKYDVKLLIQGVKDRPCLWNKNLEVYKDRMERRNAWEEIFNMLDENYEMMPPEEKRLTGEHVLNKWTNIRDTFVKTLRTKMGKTKRRYIYYDHLKFLIGDIREDQEEYVEEVNVQYMKEEDASEEDIQPRKRTKRAEHSDDSYTPKETSFKDTSHSTRKRSKKKESVSEEPPKVFDSRNDIDFVEIEEGDQRLMNEDEAFFASLLPTVVKYNEDERLEFRIEVLNVMKKIKGNRRWSNGD